MEPNPSQNAPDPALRPPEASDPVVEKRIPADRRELKPEDFAMLSRLPTRKPEYLDLDAILRAGLMVLGLAVGLWVITLFAKPKASEEPVPTPAPVLQEATPAPEAPAPVPTPEVISLTPAPTFAMPQQNAPGTPPIRRQPVQQQPAMPAQPSEESLFGGSSEEVPMEAPAPTAADTPDPSNLFPSNSR